MDRKVVEPVAAVAARLGLPMAQVAIARVLAKPDVSAPLISATKASQLEDAIATVDASLSQADFGKLEALCRTRGCGFRIDCPPARRQRAVV